MRGRRRRRFAAVAAVIALAFAGTAAGDPFGRWDGRKGAFAWEAKRLSCGEVGESPSRLRAHTRWRSSPANGYLRLTFERELRDEDTGEWTTVHRVRRSTKNSALEGTRSVVHWTQWFFPFEDEAGATTRHSVLFEWLRDRAGSGQDSVARRRSEALGSCVVAG